jgi:hypothetical protein
VWCSLDSLASAESISSTMLVALKEIMRLMEEIKDLIRSWPIDWTKHGERGSAAGHCAHPRHNQSRDGGLVDADQRICYTGATVGRCSGDSKEV